MKVGDVREFIEPGDWGEADMAVRAELVEVLDTDHGRVRVWRTTSVPVAGHSERRR